jgi:hypothetical protein
MKLKRIKMALTTALMLAGTVLISRPAQAATHFSIGIGVAPSYGHYAPPVVAYRPVAPGPGYYWVDGYYNPYGSWVAGYWAPPAYVAPYYRGYRGRDYDRDDHRRFDRDDYRGRGHEYGRRR